MSGRPTSVFTWALETSFASGPNPWQQGAASTKIEPLPDYFTPEQPMPAQWFNWLFNQISVDMQALQDFACNVPALNWWPAVPVGTSSMLSGDMSAFSRGRWDLASGLTAARSWIVGGQVGLVFPTSVGAELAVSNDHGQTWTTPDNPPHSFASNAGGFQGIAGCVDPVSGNFMGAALDVSAVLTVAIASSGAWSTVLTVSSLLGASGLNMATIGSAVVVVHSFGLLGGNGLAIHSTTNSGSTWSAFNPGITTASTEYILKSNGSQIIAFPVGVSASGLSGYYTSPDGVTWTSQAMPALTGTDVPTGLAWTVDAVGPCWILAVINRSAGSKTKFWRSADGVTWTRVNPTASHAFILSDIDAVGALLVGASDPGSPETGPSYVYFSVDGASTWFVTQNSLASNLGSSTTGYTRTRITASDTGFLMLNTGILRFSLDQGLPATEL